MFATLAASDLIEYPSTFADLSGVGLVRIGGPDDLKFDDIPGEILGFDYTDTAKEYVKIQVAFYLSEDPANDRPITANFVLRSSDTLGIEYNDPDPIVKAGPTQFPTVRTW